MDVFIMCLKLIKTGQVVASQRVKQYFLNAAREVQLLSEQDRLDPKRLEKLKEKMEEMLTIEGEKKEVPDGDYVKYFARIERKFNKLKA